MKISLLLINIILLAGSVFSQNYIGLTKPNIVKRFGIPDQVSENSVVYYDEIEKGTNTYYFSKNDKCFAFIISRDTNQLRSYSKLLKTCFREIRKYTYLSKYRRYKYKAQIILYSNRFEIKINEIDKEESNIIAQNKNL